MRAARKLTRGQYEALLWVLEEHLEVNKSPSPMLLLATQKIRDALRVYEEVQKKRHHNSMDNKQ